MRKERLLIIDDSLDELVEGGRDTRREHYRKLQPHFELDFVEQPGELPGKLRRPDISVALIDYVLSSWRADVNDVLKEIDGRYPCALISTQWVTSFPDLNRTLGNFGSQIAQLFAWTDLTSHEDVARTALGLSHAIRKYRGTALLPREADESILILQLSDIQFGGVVPVGGAAEMHLMANAIGDHFGRSPDFIALTGDVAERGLPSEYRQAEIWLPRLQEALWGSYSIPGSLLTIPGNHDICRPLAWSARLEMEKKSKEIFFKSGAAAGSWPELVPLALTPFREFALRATGGAQWAAGSNFWVSGRFRDHGVIFFGYNSCEVLDELGKPKREFVDTTLEALFQEVRRYLTDNPKALVIGLIHHPPASPHHPTEIMVNSLVLDKHLNSLRANNAVLLCGHVHDDGDAQVRSDQNTRFLEVTAPTPTQATQTDARRGFTVAELRRRDHVVVGVSIHHFSYGRDSVSLNKTRRFSRSEAGKLTSRD